MYERRLAEKKKLVKRRKSIDEAMGYQPIKAVQLDFGTQKKKCKSSIDCIRVVRIQIYEINSLESFLNALSSSLSDWVASSMNNSLKSDRRSHP